MRDNEASQLLDALRAIQRRWRLVAIIVAVTTSVALAISLSGQKRYDATAKLLLRDRDAVSSVLQPSGRGSSSDPERELNTDVDLIKSNATAYSVARRLGLERSSDDLLEQVTTKIDHTSYIVSLTARDSDRRRAAAIANAFAEAYVDFRVRYARESYENAAELAQTQLEQLAPEDRDTPEGRALAARRRELQIDAALQTGGAQIVRRASVPDSPSRPRPVLSGLLGLVGGLLLGPAVALALKVFDRRLRDEHDVEDLFGLPILAAIPRGSRRYRSQLEDPAQREAYGLLAANLRLATLSGRSDVVLITSPSPGEGKTTVTLGTAAALGRLGLRVIAIEADLRRPAFGRQIRLPRGPGLTGVISGASTLPEALVWVGSDSLQPTSQPGGDRFAVLPAGALPASAQRALSEPAVAALIEKARELADVVLIDSAPIGTVNDALTLAGRVDSIAIVARLNLTTSDAVRRALRGLRNLEAKLAGVVITAADSSPKDSYYSPHPRARQGEPAASGARSSRG